MVSLARKMKKLSENAKALILLALIFILTFFCYFPGLFGTYLFDDQPNLGGLVHYADTGNWNDAWQFVMSGFAGPTGRPISLLSFVFQADSWATNPFAFKLVNLFIHLSCGILLFKVILLILQIYGYTKKNIWIAVAATGIWLLHPLFVSTTLYVVQRMAQLPLLFSLLGIWGYLQGRLLITTSKRFAYSLMTLSIVICTVLATFSKENGALLPLLVLIIEFCNPQKHEKPVLIWRIIFLWFPSLAIAALLLYYVDFSDNPWPYRSFNQVERLLTEGRILIDYLTQLLVPRVEGYGLYQDGYSISKSWTNPISTLWSILLISVLIIFALVFRKKFPLFSLAVLFFFASHLIESSVIGLELYFEHRNYLSAIFLFLPIASGLVYLSERITPSIVVVLYIILILVLSAMTWQRAQLWSNTTKLLIYWAQNNPYSVRAQIGYADILMSVGQYPKAHQVLEDTIKVNPKAILVIKQFSQNISTQQDRLEDLQKIEYLIFNERADGSTIWALRDLTQQIKSNTEAANKYGNEYIQLLNRLHDNASYRNFKDFLALSKYMEAQIYIGQHRPREAYISFYEAAKAYKDLSAALAMVAELANYGYREQALQLLSEIDVIYKTELFQIANADMRNKLQHDIQVDIELKKND